MPKSQDECSDCFDTGCICGSIGLDCHGCCPCPKGDEVRKNREIALAEIEFICSVLPSIPMLHKEMI